jgi:hypothetical protein
MKQTIEHPAVPPSHWIVDATFEFNDDEEIQEEEDDAQHHTDYSEPNMEMMQPLRLEIGLRIVDVSS